LSVVIPRGRFAFIILKSKKMEIIDPEQKKYFEERNRKSYSSSSENSGRIIGGIIVITVGVLLLARMLGIYFPGWLFSWQTILIAIGLFIGSKQSFQPGGWMIAVLIGTVFLLDYWIPEITIRPYIWPVILILVGLFMLVRPQGGKFFRKRKREKSNWSDNTLTSSEELIEAVSVFGGTKRNIITKNFKGGEITNIFGGSDINLTQADIQGKAFLEVNQVFGGTTLIIPSNWLVQSESTAILGSVEDLRLGNKDNIDPNKVLILEGTSVFGGISIKSY